MFQYDFGFVFIVQLLESTKKDIFTNQFIAYSIFHTLPPASLTRCEAEYHWPTSDTHINTFNAIAHSATRRPHIPRRRRHWFFGASVDLPYFRRLRSKDELYRYRHHSNVFHIWIIIVWQIRKHFVVATTMWTPISSAHILAYNSFVWSSTNCWVACARQSKNKRIPLHSVRVYAQTRRRTNMKYNKFISEQQRQSYCVSRAIK